jgi:hypothetical protein
MKEKLLKLFNLTQSKSYNQLNQEEKTFVEEIINGMDQDLFSEISLNSHKNIYSNIFKKGLQEFTNDDFERLDNSENYYHFFLYMLKSKSKEAIISALVTSSKDKIEEMIKYNDYEAFKKTASYENIEAMYFILDCSSQDERKSMIKSNDYEAFRKVASMGTVWTVDGFEITGKVAGAKAAEMLNFFSKDLTLGERKSMIKSGDYEAFRVAALKKDSEVMFFLLKNSDPKERKYAIMKNDYEVFRSAAENKNIEIINLLFKASIKKEKENMIKSENYKVLEYAAKDEKMMDFLFENSAPEEICNMIKSSNYYALKVAAVNENEKMMRLLLDNLNPENTFEQGVNIAFKYAASREKTAMMNFLFEKLPEKKFDIIKSEQYEIFKDAADKNHIKTMRLIFENLNQEEKDVLLNENYALLTSAVAKGNVEIAKLILENLDPKNKESKIMQEVYRAFSFAVNRNIEKKPELINLLLIRAPNLAMQKVQLSKDAKAVLLLKNTLLATQSENQFVCQLKNIYVKNINRLISDKFIGKGSAEMSPEEKLDYLSKKINDLRDDNKPELQELLNLELKIAHKTRLSAIALEMINPYLEKENIQLKTEKTIQDFIFNLTGKNSAEEAKVALCDFDEKKLELVAMTIEEIDKYFTLNQDSFKKISEIKDKGFYLHDIKDLDNLKSISVFEDFAFKNLEKEAESNSEESSKLNENRPLNNLPFEMLQKIFSYYIRYIPSIGPRPFSTEGNLISEAEEEARNSIQIALNRALLKNGVSYEYTLDEAPNSNEVEAPNGQGLQNNNNNILNL